MNQYIMSHTVVHSSPFISRVLDDSGDNSPLNGPCMLIFLDIVSLRFSLLAKWHSHLLTTLLGGEGGHPGT